MFEQLAKKVSLMTGQEIIETIKKAKYRFLLGILVLLVFYLYFGMINQPILYCLAFFLMFVLLVFHIATRAYIAKGREAILSEHLDLDRYEDIIENYSGYKASELHSKSKSEKNFYYFRKCQILFLKGDFTGSLDALEQIDPKTFNRFNQLQNTLAYCYFGFLNRVFAKQDYNLSDYQSRLASLTTKNKAQEDLVAEQWHIMEALDKIVTHHEVNHYFEGGEPKSHLDKVLRTYYNGLNANNQGDLDRAKTFFAQIVNENLRLFVVREAKKYLSGMEDAKK